MHAQITQKHGMQALARSPAQPPGQGGAAALLGHAGGDTEGIVASLPAANVFTHAGLVTASGYRGS